LSLARAAFPRSFCSM